MTNTTKARVRTRYWRALSLYIRLRRAYAKHGVLPYSRLKTWGEAKFSTRMEQR